jgi:uncharacterized membrane protein
MKYLSSVLKGILMGMANKVPGVSGGTVAFVLGFYQNLIFSFQRINLKAFKLLFTGRFKSFYAYINGSFLFPIMLGSLISYFSFSLILEYLIEHYGVYVWSVFFGMVIGSIIYIYRGYGEWTRNHIFQVFVGTAIGLGVMFISPGTENDSLWFVFVCGIIGVSGMTLPGLSGSFILMILGNYVLLMVDSVNVLFFTLTQVFSGDFSFWKDTEQMKYLKIIAVFGAGSLFGLISLSQLLSFVLKKYNAAVRAVIMGFITGSLGAVWPWKTPVYKADHLDALGESKQVLASYNFYIPELFASETIWALVFVVMGSASVLCFDYLAKKIQSRRL